MRNPVCCSSGREGMAGYRTFPAAGQPFKGATRPLSLDRRATHRQGMGESQSSTV